eukprot:433985-Ditylum_brightwellii.AAC.2
MDERSKVRILNKNIKTNTVETVKTQILGDPKMQDNLDACTSPHKLFISQSKSMRKSTINVFSATTLFAKPGTGKALEKL